MFVEAKGEARGKWAALLEARARQHSGVFTLGLLLLAIGVTIGLLMKVNNAVVLYQGF